MLKKRVAVLRGGPSAEYEVSMMTGAGVLQSLRRLNYTAHDVVVSKTGDWIESGFVRRPEHILSTVDVVFIAMHGAYGEDGTVQRICENYHIPFTGSNSFPSRLAFNKDTTKRALQSLPIKLPKHVKVQTDDIPMLDYIISAIDSAFRSEFVIKPVASGSSDGVVMIKDTADLKKAILDTLAVYDSCLVEERIIGTEATCGVLEHYRGESYYILPPVEIVPPSSRDFFDYEVKYNGTTEEICPARFSIDIREKIAAVALHAHKALRLSQYSRTDVIVKGNDVYFLEVNTLPGLTNESLFPKAAAAVGMSYDQLINHLIMTARVR